jgi:hypothetical protein
MFKQMMDNYGFVESPQTECIAELSLASPIGRRHFSLPDSLLIGYTVNHDVLQLLTPITDNDFLPFLETDVSRQAEQAFATLSGQDLLNAQWTWGKKIHDVNHNYLQYPDTRLLVQDALDHLYDRCQTWAP